VKVPMGCLLVQTGKQVNWTIANYTIFMKCKWHLLLW
jgi:hypothetical protein